MMSAADIATLTANRPISGLPTGLNPKTMSNEQIDKAAKDFESVFISQMLDKMYGDTEGDDAFGDSDSSDIYRSMMVDQYTKQIVNSGGIGIANQVKKELLKLQEK